LQLHHAILLESLQVMRLWSKLYPVKYSDKFDEVPIEGKSMLMISEWPMS